VAATQRSVSHVLYNSMCSCIQLNHSLRYADSAEQFQGSNPTPKTKAQLTLQVQPNTVLLPTQRLSREKSALLCRMI
jgi:hypothetical protein